MIEMDRDAIEVVCPEGARLASFLPIRAKHEVVDDQLGAPIEQIGKREPAVRSFKPIGFFHALPGQGPPAPRQDIALPHELFLGCEQVTARLQPFLTRHDLVLHISPPALICSVASEWWTNL